MTTASRTEMASTVPIESAMAVTDWGPVNRSLQDLFSAHPAKYSVDERCSSETRGPQYFDLHLKEELQLKRLVLAEDLPRALADLCTNKIADQQRQGNFPKGPLSLDTLSTAVKPRMTKINREDDVRDDYARRIIDPCIVPASVIALGETQWPEDNHQSRPFSWIVHTSVTGSPAQCDGNIIADDSYEDKGGIFSMMAQHHLGKLVVYEHKNPVAGDKQSLLAITRLASENHGLFKWITCRSCHFGKYFDCNQKRHSKSTFRAETGRKTGPDSTDSWLLNQLLASPVPPGSEDQSILTESLPHENTRTPWQADYEKAYYMLLQVCQALYNVSVR